MNWKSFFCVVVLALAALSIASAQSVSVIEASKLQAAPTHRTVELSEKIVWVRKAASWMQRDVEQGLLPGKYDFQLQDPSGVYHLGPELAVYMVDRSSVIVARGGVWIPASPSARPRFFVIEEGNPRRGKTLAEALSSTPPGATVFPLAIALVEAWAVAANRGNLVMLQEIQDDAVASRLRTVFQP